jgi:hypothetical protein
LFGAVAVVLIVLSAIVAVQNVALSAFFPHLSRVTTDFSSAYLQRELNDLAAGSPQVVFLGDSVLWGYALKTDQTAIFMLQSQGCECRNLAFKSGAPVNEYALALLFKAWGIRPARVVIEINQRAFTASDAANYRFHPAIADLADPLLSRDDRTELSLPPLEPETPARRADRILSSLSVLYAMRSDIRETLLPTSDPLPAKAPATADFEGTYDLQALDDDNISVHFLEKTVALFHAEHIPVVAFMTPVNHVLVHPYVDTPEYRANGAYLQQALKRNGARVLDLDTAFSTNEFLDNDHLTSQGQIRLASILAKETIR